MNIQRWIARRQPSWQELDTLLKKAEKQGLKTLKADEIRQLSSLYRSVSGDLARAKTNQVGELVVRDLHSLTTRGYSQIYQGSRRQEWRAIREFYLWGFPAAVQQAGGYIAFATALFVLAGLIGWWLSWRDPNFLRLIVPGHLIEQVRDRGELWMGSIVGMEPFASSSIMINNIQVSLAAVAGGMTAGLLTLYSMLLNGLMIGTIGALVTQNNLAFPFWAFVFPHGALELPAIFLAGGAGFLLARAIVFPGQYRRSDALKLYGTRAAQLVFGLVPMLVIAGIIEGFFSPNPYVPNVVKYLAGLVLFVSLIAYLSRKRL
ncbi:stage II sporulation protein M [Pantanalinema sp. GBBB05]|uniref:stage II sporulation protein M n=1 Tax=Pantanalinema sp. GBBB05 TaxID=2604139 RepID=UPI001D83CF58|nr:stage II sporulation protein M [Pantanalinema sp. GBBB05]